MVDVFVERRGPQTRSAQREPDTAACCDIYRARWQGSYVAEAGRQICHYRAPDAESVRLAFRNAGVSVDAVWTGTVHGDTRPSTQYIVVDLEFLPPLPVDAIGALELAQAVWLAPIGLRLAQAIVSATHGRVICMCEAPHSDTTRVSRAWINGEGRVWSCRSIAAPSAQPRA